jgi:hypothetical protein
MYCNGSSWARDISAGMANIVIHPTAGIIFNTTGSTTSSDISERMRITADGLVGIGTSSPTTSLTIRPINGSTNALSILDPVGTAQRIAQISFGNATNDGEITLDSNGTNNVRISSNRLSYFNGGNVGIGTNAPTTTASATTLEVYNGSNANTEIRLTNSHSGQGSTAGFSLISDSSSIAYVYNRSNSAMILATNNTERMRITSGGDTQIAAGKAIYCYGSDAKSYGWTNLADGNLSFTSVQFGVKATIAAFNGAYTALSDVNKKKDFEDSTIGLSAIMGLKPTLFRFKDDEDNESQKDLGFIAQEVKEFIPQAYKENGSFIGLQDRPIIATLVKAIQELNTKFEEYKATHP